MPLLPRKFFCLVSDKDKGVHHFDKDELAILLTNIQPDQSWETPSQIEEIAEVPGPNGYPKGGFILRDRVYSAKDGVSKVGCSRATIVADGSDLGPFRWVVIINKTAGRLIAFIDYGSSRLVDKGERVTIDFPSGVYLGV